MSGHAVILRAGICCALCLPICAQEAPNVFEASALINLDIGGVAPANLSPDSLPAGLGDAELGLAWQTRNGLSANAVLLLDQGTFALDQAWGAVDRGSARFDFGLFTLAHGINESRLVHDPLLQQHVESILPGVSATARLGSVEPSLALSARERPIKPVDEELEPGSRQEAVLTAAVDWSFLDGGLLRASSQISSDRRDAVLGAAVPTGILLLDAEVAAGSGPARAYDAGFLAGAEAKLSESVALAMRADGLLVDDRWTRSVAAGISWSPLAGTTLAAEWLQDLDGDGILTFRAGMELGWKSSN